MLYASTRDAACTANGPEAILKGIAPDGGLFTPVDFSDMRIDMEKILKMNAVEISAEVIGKLLPDFSPEEMRALITAAYEGKFSAPDLTPVVKVGDDFVLELFRGPTSAFKDVALSVLPRLITAGRAKVGMKEEIVILTATSGDTGKAALEGFRDVPGTRIIVFYPDGGVSDVQKAQMATQQGANVDVVAVKGNFDDAQTGVKRIFADDGANGWAAASGVRLSSANSINLGRLAPQVAYYFKSYADLVNRGEIKNGEKINFCVPTGNFGDILAGEFARRMGLPVGRLICASNANNVLTDFIRTGVYDRVRDFKKTVSPSMDILVSSNLERYLLLLTDYDHAFVAEKMRELNEKGVYDIGSALTEKMGGLFSAYCADDKEALRIISEVWTKYGYLLDTHTAAGWSAMEQFHAEGGNGLKTVVLATASPYKFAKAVLGAISDDVPEDGFEAMEALRAKTGTEIPKNLAALKGQAHRFTRVIAKEDMRDYVRASVSAKAD